jgi:type I restriction enzyme M protein
MPLVNVVSFIWSIADDVLRDLFRRGNYPDVILPMCVLRRLDAVLEPTKKATLETRRMLDDAGITEQTATLFSASGQAFCTTSKFTLRDLISRSNGNQPQLLALIAKSPRKNWKQKNDAIVDPLP